MRTHLIAHTRFGVSLRWGEVVAYERALAEYNALVGVEILHPDMQSRLATCRAKILELHAATELIAGPFELPEPSEANTDSMRSRFDWEALDALTKNAPAADPWKWMPEKEKAELAEAEERWVAEVRG